MAETNIAQVKLLFEEGNNYLLKDSFYAIELRFVSDTDDNIYASRLSLVCVGKFVNTVPLLYLYLIT